MKRQAVVILSGGQDSTTCLYWAKSHGYRVHAVTFDYNQRHRSEIEAAKIVADRAGVESHEIVELGPVLKGTSPLVSDAKLAEYDDHRSLPGGLEKTYVPMRNQLFLTIAANRAYVLGASALVIGVSQEDYGGYPDCREDFIRTVYHATNLALPGTHKLAIQTPLLHRDKCSTVKLALSLKGCYEALAWTVTGYSGEYPPVKKDHANLLRAKGFEKAGVPDPLVLRAHFDGLMALPDTPNYTSAAVDHYLTLYPRLVK